MQSHAAFALMEITRSNSYPANRRGQRGVGALANLMENSQHANGGPRSPALFGLPRTPTSNKYCEDRDGTATRGSLRRRRGPWKDHAAGALASLGRDNEENQVQSHSFIELLNRSDTRNGVRSSPCER